MEDEIQTTASEDVTIEETPQPVEVTTDEKESTLGEILDDSEDTGRHTGPESKKYENTPEWKTLEFKKEIKELKRQLKEKEINGNQFSESTKELLEEYSDVDPNFISKIISVAKEEAKKELLPEFDKLKASDKAKNVQSNLKQLLAKSISQNPDYEEVVNEDVILQLAQDPRNHTKTMSQLIEETYGKTLNRGSRSIETQTGGKDKSEVIDFDNLTEKEEAEVLKDPVLKKKYAKHQFELMKNQL